MANPGINVVAAPVGPAYEAAPTNGALELAQALHINSPAITGAVQAVGAQLKAKQESEAHTAVMLTNGAKFGDAVREGKIEPTQNPWFINAYNLEAANVRGKSDLAQLREQSQTWEERTDAKAFQAKWNEEVGKLGGEYQGVDAQRGFTAAANEATQQALASNTAENVERINTERKVNLGTLIADRVGDLAQKRGGRVTGAEAFGSIEDLHHNWIFSGGTEVDWDKLVAQGVRSAAYGSNNSTLLDVLKDERDGKGSIYNAPGMAEQIENDRYYISNAKDRAMDDGYEAGLKLRRRQSQAASDDAFATFGTKLITGEVDPQEVVRTLAAKGHSAQAIAKALNDERNAVSDMQGLANARLEANGNPDRTKPLDLYKRARTEGTSPELETEISKEVLSGSMTDAEGIRLLDVAADASERLGKTTEKGIGGQVKIAGQLKSASDNVAAATAYKITSELHIALTNDAVSAIKDRVAGAAMAAMYAQGATADDAYTAARKEAAAILREYAQRAATQAQQRQNTQGRGNPRSR